MITKKYAELKFSSRIKSLKFRVFITKLGILILFYFLINDNVSNPLNALNVKLKMHLLN